MNVDECKIINFILGKGGYMIDVGAHKGSSCIPFLKRNWNVLAFEPCTKTRRTLNLNILNLNLSHLIKVDPRGVSNFSSKSHPIYSSEESSGVTTLTPFLNSHKIEETIDLVSLRDYFQNDDNLKIDFLKIDAEGHDFDVLKGFPFEKCLPNAIICEFEDKKTLPLGYSWEDMANFLLELDYHVYISEWKQIQQYGTAHHWHSLKKYPANLYDENNWGNLISLRKRPIIPLCVYFYINAFWQSKFMFSFKKIIKKFLNRK